ncbi:putative betaine aldehyde [Mycena sanguinolenta]|uniref:Putative betaine aldehyde n=1 Tax=Mycena sanguinolenta TaxID=230812 RepID=A0A8H6X8J3_9AGAR|nr:putative betaine aldehyde [Mycena sanguinolenta]
MSAIQMTYNPDYKSTDTAQTTISPVDLQPISHRTYPTSEALDATIARAAAAQKAWAAVPLAERIAIGHKFIEEFTGMSERLPGEITKQMGRPITQGAGEVRGFLERAKYLLSIAESSLSDISLEGTDKPGFRRFMKRLPLGVVLVITPWNYPYLTAVNSVLPAIIAGNAVLLKPSPQTPLSGERFTLVRISFFSVSSINYYTASTSRRRSKRRHHHSASPPKLTTQVIQSPLVNFVSFTGSVATGRAVEEAAVTAPGFKGVALELGGKDPAYVRADADLDYTAAELVEGAMFNSGQSCCAVERIYVHEEVYDNFVSKFVEIVKKYKLGDPTRQDVTIGPVVGLDAAKRIRKQIEDAVAAGAKALIPPEQFRASRAENCYVGPQVLVDVDHTMDIMKEEIFGPVVGIQKVASDEEAVKLMNDTPYGLTASIWTNAAEHPESEEAFLKLEEQLECGTVFLNRQVEFVLPSPPKCLNSCRCDYLDPELAWTGVKDSGRGISLSKFGYDQLTRVKNVHMKIKTT